MSSNRPPRASARFRTEESLSRERRLLDEICRESATASSETTALLDRARRRTDTHLAGERLEMDEALLLGSRNLTDEKGSRDSADAALADRGRLLATFGHDIRNLLNVLVVNATLAAKESAGGSRSLENLQATVRRMDRLTSNLLDLARLNAGTFHVALDWRNAAAVVREAVELFRPLALAKSLSLESTSADAALPAKFDQDRVFQVLSNLLCNAIAATPEGGQVSVSAERVDGHIRIAVRDSGCGIAEGDLDRIFNAYSQLDARGRGGLGLGLFISRSIVQAHEGRIWAESKPGAGSTFFFTVPATQSSPARASSPAISRSTGGQNAAAAGRSVTA